MPKAGPLTQAPGMIAQFAEGAPTPHNLTFLPVVSPSLDPFASDRCQSSISAALPFFFSLMDGADGSALSQASPTAKSEGQELSASPHTTVGDGPLARGDDGGEGQPKAKRRRVAVACKSCRYRKSRCDGIRPKCSTCQDLGFECEYSTIETNKPFPRSFTDTLATRLGAVEEALFTLTSRVDRHDNQIAAAKRDAALLGNGRVIASAGTSTPHDASGNDSAILHDATDGMGSVSFSEEENTGFFGPSSNIAFTRQIVRAVKATLRSQPLQPRRYGNEDHHQQNHMLHVSRPPSPLHQRIDTDDWRTENPISMALPPDEDCMRLIHQYFGRTGVLFPYIHEESFIATYNSFKATHFRKVRRSWLGLLNMILAMATRTAVNSKLSAQEREEQSDTFFVRGWRLCEKQVKYSPSLEIVQFLLLLSQYLQGTSQGAETWNAHGLTVKSAYQLGLHSTDALKQYPPLEREIRKRSWYMCVLLDRTLSMTFGRPFVIPASYIRVQLPEPYDMDASLPLGGMSSISSSPQSLNFFRATIRLFGCIWNIIDSLYGGNLGCGEISSVFDITSRLLHIEQELLEWQRTLPPDMSLVTHAELKRSQTETTLPLRYRVILTLRFNNIRILAHRPILVKFLDVIGGAEGDTQELSMLTQVGMDSVQTCVQSASTILEIVGYLVNAGDMRRTLLGAWWYTLYYTFNAALVIFSALLIKHISTRSSARPIAIPYPPTELSKSFLRQAVDTLMALDNENRMVEKCARYISKLYNILEQLETAPILPSNINGNQHMGPITSMPNYANTILNPVSSNGNGQAQGVSPQDWGYMVPNDPTNFGIDMNEFLVSGDLDLLGQMGGQNFL